jgi:uncharacterized protein with HEPN domain
MTIEEKKLLLDIFNSINSIDEYLNKKRIFSEFEKNKIVRRAIERELEIIGEAINRLLRINEQIRISHARTIVDLRNRVIHAYDSVDETIIWKIIMKDIPVLLTEVKELLNQ